MTRSQISDTQVEFFLSGNGVVREVLERDAVKYLGDAEIQRAELDGKRGFLVTAYRAFTKQEHASLKKESARWQIARENGRASEASGTRDDEVTTQGLKATRHVYPEPQSEVKRNSVSGPPRDSTYQGHDRDVSLAQGNRKESLRKYYYDGLDRVSSRDPPLATERASSATIRSSDGIKLYDRQRKIRYRREKAREKLHQETKDEVVLPAIGSLSVDDYRVRRPPIDSERQRPLDSRRPLYHVGTAEDRQKRYTLPGEKIDADYGKSEDHRKDPDRYEGMQPRRSSFYDDRRPRKGGRKVLIDDLDSVTGAQHVMRDPKEPLSTRSQNLKQSERSRRIREIGRKEVADEQAAFRRQKSIEHLDLVGEDDEESEMDVRGGRRGNRSGRGRYEDA